MTAVAAFQADLLCACPGLQARGYVRRDEAGTRATLMETYAAPAAGMDAALQALVLSRGSEVLGPWSLGGRKLEVFERLAP
jgi:hypothetical protein